MYFVYDKETNKILNIYTSDSGIKLKENEAVKYIEANDCSQTDIRAYNEDGTVKSLGTQIKEKILILQPNEVIKDGVVVELNPAYEDDYIRLIQRNLETLDDTQKIEYQEENKKYAIIEKTIEEKLEDNLITVEDYNNHIVEVRQGMYASQLDSKRAELLDIVLNRLSETGTLTEEERQLLSELNSIREAIKEKNPKRK